MLTLIEHGTIYDPEPIGQQSVLLAGQRILKIGSIERRTLDVLDVPCQVIDARNCIVTPGLIDPHEHLLGGSGESGFSSQTPAITPEELACAGITTVVGCLGVDTTMLTLPGLLGKVKALREVGLTAYLYTGGYNVPPTTMLTSVREDILFIEEVIGAGEIAIADVRSTDPAPRELARLVNDAYVGGLLSRKAGITHFHVGEQSGRLALLRQLIEDFDVDPAWLYPTHIERSEALMCEAIALAARGAAVDIDTVEHDLAKWLRFYLDEGGDPARLTVSSDASKNRPKMHFEQLRGCVREHGFRLEDILPLATVNPATVLQLGHKGRLKAGHDADLLVLTQGGLEITHVFARGQWLVRDRACTLLSGKQPGRGSPA